MDSKDWFANQTVMTSVDNLVAASKSNIIPNKEYLLQGSIMDSAVDVLLHRLRGLCDNVDSGPETFHDHEICFSIKGTATQPLFFKVRRAMDCTEDMPYQLRYVGEPEIGDKNRPTIVRTSMDVAVTPSIIEFLTEMGYRMEFEYIARGYMFRKGRMKILVSKIFKMMGQSQGKTHDSLDLVSKSYLVELSVLASSGHEAIGEDMKAFAEQLKPLVILDKFDYKRF